jgi:hypothetical protein
MKPTGSGAAKSLAALEDTLASAEPQYIKWESSFVIIINNWRVLHARGSEPLEDDKSRVLERVLVNSPSS